MAASSAASVELPRSADDRHEYPFLCRSTQKEFHHDLDRKTRPRDGRQQSGAYVRSKTLAERAAWDFVAREGGTLELSVVNRVGIFGPVLGGGLSASTLIIQRMLDGGMPACPRVYFGVVDVRDVAALHILAMTHPDAKGERFLGVAGDCVSMFDVAQMLHRRLGAAAEKAPRRQMPDWLLRIASLTSTSDIPSNVSTPAGARSRRSSDGEE